MRAAVFRIKVGKRNAATAGRAGDFDLGAEHHQGRGEIAAEGGVAALALRRDVAGIAAMLEAIVVGVPPPFALIVVDAARIEAEIAADGRHGAVAGSGDRFGGFAAAR